MADQPFFVPVRDSDVDVMQRMIAAYPEYSGIKIIDDGKGSTTAHVPRSVNMLEFFRTWATMLNEGSAIGRERAQ